MPIKYRRKSKIKKMKRKRNEEENKNKKKSRIEEENKITNQHDKPLRRLAGSVVAQLLKLTVTSFTNLSPTRLPCPILASLLLCQLFAHFFPSRNFFFFFFFFGLPPVPASCGLTPGLLHGRFSCSGASPSCSFIFLTMPWIKTSLASNGIVKGANKFRHQDLSLRRGEIKGRDIYGFAHILHNGKHWLRERGWGMWGNESMARWRNAEEYS